MNLHTKQKTLILYIFLFTCIITGCETQTDTEKHTLRITIREYDAHTSHYFQNLADEYMKLNPNVVIHTDIIPWESGRDFLDTWNELSLRPDICNIPTIDLPDYVDQNIAASLDQFTTGNFLHSFYRPLLDANRFDGKLHGLPFSLSLQSMYINQKIFNELKLTPPKNWEEFIQTAQKIQKPPERYAFGIDGKDMELCNLFFYVYWSNGGEFTGESGNFQINRGLAIDSLQVILDLMYRYKITQPDPFETSREDLQDLFKNNQLAMIITGSWFINLLRLDEPEFNYAVIPIPVLKEAVTFGNMDSLILFQSSINKKIAFEYMRYMYREKNRVEFDKIHGMVPVTIQAGMDPYFKDNPNRKIFIDQVDRIKIFPFIKNKKQIMMEFNNAIQSVYSRKSTPTKAIDDLIQVLENNNK